MTIEIRQKLVDQSMYKYKCPYFMKAEFIVVHNTANDASAENEIAYMIRNTNHVSFHFAVDDKEVVQGISLDRNAWHAGDGGQGKGNRKGIGIEICYSKSGGDRFNKSEENASKLIAQLLDERGWGTDKVFRHFDFSKKYCPHRTMDLGWDRFLKMIESNMKSAGQKEDTDFKYGKVTKCSGYVEIIYNGADGVDYHAKPVFDGYVAGTAHKGEIFTVVGKVNVNGYLMYKLKSGVYITGAKAYVEYRTTLHKKISASDQKKLKVGAKVMIKNDAKKYATGQEIADYYKNVKYTIKEISKDKSKVLIDELTSWVYAEDILFL